MSGPDLNAIPLPADDREKKEKKSAKEMLEKALRDRKTSSSSESSSSNLRNTNKLAKALGPKIKTSQDGFQSSQSIVDELFKDYISQKLYTGTKEDSVQVEEQKDTKASSSVEEMSKILDMEIKSLSSHSDTGEPSKKEQSSKREESSRKEESSKRSSHKHKKSKSHKSSKSSSSRSKHKSSTDDSERDASNSHRDSVPPPQIPTPLKDPDVVSAPTRIPTPPKDSVAVSVPSPQTDTRAEEKSETQSNSTKLSPGTKESEPEKPPSSEPTETSDTSNKDEDSKLPKATITSMLPVSVAKKMPKQLGLKLSEQSMTLIKSNDRIDRDGRVWEEGEVVSSHSENSDKDSSDSDNDGFPSETGSIDSEAEDWRSQTSTKHKKKHKHKHKKKKKKSSKEKTEASKKEKSDEKDKNETSKEKSVLEGGESVKKSDVKDSKHESRKDKHSSSKEESSRSKDEAKRSEDSRRSKDEKDKEDKRSKSKGSEKSKDERKRRNSKSRSRSPKRRKRSRSRSKSKSPSKSSRRSRNGGHSHEWDASHYGEGTSKSRKSRSRSRSPRSQRKHSKDKSRTDKDRAKRKQDDKDLRLQIDKAKLRKIAIANALQNMKSGQGPQVADVATIKSGGKSVEELTDFCKKISDKEKERLENDISDSSDEEPSKNSDDEDTLIHHPFKIKDTSSNIVMNIRNAKQLPVLTPSEKQAQQAALRLTFPVSSGSHHRANESEWVPVEKTTAPPAPVKNKATTSTAAMPPPPPPEPPKPAENIFAEQEAGQKIDIGSIISERLQAVRKLQENPYDMQALTKMHQVQEKASKWASSKHLPGQFVGTTGATVMSQQEILGDRRNQAWAKKAQLTQAAPLAGGIGMFLLQKMGWKQGEGLGKHNEGSKEPLMLDVKIDRKGLSAQAEHPMGRGRAQGGGGGNTNVPRAKDLSNKHPVSALMELCNRRKWGPPIFTVVNETGPDHKKNFLFKVCVNNVEYQPSMPSTNKKLAKAQCAGVCLQEMGLIPRDAPLNI